MSTRLHGFHAPRRLYRHGRSSLSGSPSPINCSSLVRVCILCGSALLDPENFLFLSTHPRCRNGTHKRAGILATYSALDRVVRCMSLPAMRPVRRLFWVTQHVPAQVALLFLHITCFFFSGRVVDHPALATSEAYIWIARYALPCLCLVCAFACSNFPCARMKREKGA